MDCPDLKFPKVLKKFPEKKWKFRVRKPSFSREAFGRNVGDVTSPEGNTTSRGFFEALEIGKLFWCQTFWFQMLIGFGWSPCPCNDNVRESCKDDHLCHNWLLKPPFYNWLLKPPFLGACKDVSNFCLSGEEERYPTWIHLTANSPSSLKLPEGDLTHFEWILMVRVDFHFTVVFREAKLAMKLGMFGPGLNSSKM